MQKFLSLTRVICLFIFILFAFSRCADRNSYPETPYIEFIDITKVPSTNGIDDKAIIRFSFTDGDGDIGLSQEDTLDPYNSSGNFYYNLFVNYYEKQNGNFIKIDLPITNNARVPVVTPKGRNKAIKGEIEVELFINNPFSIYDTIKYQFYLLDRALHQSNTVFTDEIVVKKN